MMPYVSIEQYIESPEFISKTILLHRRNCIVDRILYYCFDGGIRTDAEYDANEGRLKDLVRRYPLLAQQTPYSQLCPVICVGSSKLEDYPEELVEIARRIKG